MSISSLFKNPASSNTNLSMNSLAVNPLNSSQIAALTPSDGTLVYNSEANLFECHIDGEWRFLTASIVPTPVGGNYAQFYYTGATGVAAVTGPGISIPFTNMGDFNPSGWGLTATYGTGGIIVPVGGTYLCNYTVAITATGGTAGSYCDVGCDLNGGETFIGPSHQAVYGTAGIFNVSASFITEISTNDVLHLDCGTNVNGVYTAKGSILGALGAPDSIITASISLLQVG